MTATKLQPDKLGELLDRLTYATERLDREPWQVDEIERRWRNSLERRYGDLWDDDDLRRVLGGID